MVDAEPMFLLKVQSNTMISIGAVRSFVGRLYMLHAFLMEVGFVQFFDPFAVSGSRNNKEFTHGFYFEFFFEAVDCPMLRGARRLTRNSVWNFLAVRPPFADVPILSVQPALGADVSLAYEKDNSPSCRYMRTQASISSDLYTSQV